MTIPPINSKSQKPELYEKGSAFMWNDPYISEQLLQIHLNPDVDLASRKKTTIEHTAKWILDLQKEKGKLNILDLGCGPGLYTEHYARKGHKVSGIDISKNSIDYARNSSQRNDLNITYINANYLKLEPEEDKYDLITLIYTDLGVLFPDDRNTLMNWIYRALKKGGLFVFDVLSDKELTNKVTPGSSEEVTSGFWSSSPHLLLSESFLYEEQKVILYQHRISKNSGKVETYRFWTHFFSEKDISKILETIGFRAFSFHDDILPAEGEWSGDNVIFTVAEK
ncbi:MAG TPA: methyltransferase domain-containing protein [Draconibacterium sp.]|nr:methyltransferase domain-containing protein [Draconibacterium sp.]